jgi:hypothetical protein
MSYEDLEEARAKGVLKDSAQAAKGKGNRGQKCKSDTPEANKGDADTAKRSRKRKSATQDPPEPGNKVALAPVTASVVQVGGPRIAEEEIVPESWRAPVARMY